MRERLPPPSRDVAQVNVDMSPRNVLPLTKLLHTMAREEAYSKGLGPQAPPALVTIEATIKVSRGKGWGVHASKGCRKQEDATPTPAYNSAHVRN